ncbi:MAG: zf-HC2 domain-containing protein [Rubricoccaceae bacterium]|nr:zf-HC2 domain-containing protein [Rubricoccaceae bacterium]
MSPCADPRAETLLNLYADGELPSGQQPELFAHLARCAACRAQFNALLAFRLAARQEALLVPPAADEAFLARIDRLRRAAHPAPDRAAERRALGSPLRRRVPLGLALAAVALVVALGLVSRPAPPDTRATAPAFRLTEVVLDDGNALYVMDNITVEGEQDEGGADG